MRLPEALWPRCIQYAPAKPQLASVSGHETGSPEGINTYEVLSIDSYTPRALLKLLHRLASRAQDLHGPPRNRAGRNWME
jgi:hypothetical protein